jgi:1-deoxy-D-xylulose-5-phosphate reductoisomerase
VLRARAAHAVDRLILTASGGPFRNWSLADMAEATPEQALAHPNWDMGAKISIGFRHHDEQGGLELIEAHLLFGLPGDQIEIVVHAIGHPFDGGLSRWLGAGPSSAPLTCAYRSARAGLALAHRRAGGAAGFCKSFPAHVRTARFWPLSPRFVWRERLLVLGGFAPTVLNAANEVAVAAFLAASYRFPRHRSHCRGCAGCQRRAVGLPNVTAASPPQTRGPPPGREAVSEHALTN